MGFFNRDFSFSEILSALLRTVDESPHRGKERKGKERKETEGCLSGKETFVTMRL